MWIMEWYEIIISILTGIAATIPLAIKLVQYVEKLVKEKNWGNLVNLVIQLMAEAEGKFDTGAERKEWVLSMVESSANTVNYDINIDDVSNLIDSLCEMAKKVNAKITEEVAK
jgi:hypothetical protein